MIRLAPYPVCVYCGVPVRQRPEPKHPVTCSCHRDLPALDPHFADPDQWANAR